MPMGVTSIGHDHWQFCILISQAAVQINADDDGQLDQVVKTIPQYQCHCDEHLCMCQCPSTHMIYIVFISSVLRNDDRLMGL